MDTNTKASSILTSLSEFLDIGESGVEIIKDCLNTIHQASPLDAHVVFNRIEHIISLSDDLSYLILSINRKRTSMLRELKTIKDPQFVALVRADRPSTAAIESEIRLSKPIIKDIEYNISIIDDTLIYLNHIEKGLNDYSRLLRDKLNSV